MTIPSRPAPPPPNSRNQNNSTSTSNSSVSRYTPTTNWDDNPFCGNGGGQGVVNTLMINKKMPPPRPPPPKTRPSNLPVLKKPGTQHSVNILSNIFGTRRAKTPPNKTVNIGFGNASKNNPKIPPKIPPPPVTASSNSQQLIDFSSPPSSPTLTQKSNSDCISIDSFSSDSIYSPNNGNASQTESGFEDDFTVESINIKGKWDSNDPFALPGENGKPQIAQKPVSLGSTLFYSCQSEFVKSKNFDDPLCNGKSLITPASIAFPTIIRPTGAIHSNGNGKKSPLDNVSLKKLYELKQSENINLIMPTGSSPPSPPMPLYAPPPPPLELVENQSGFKDDLYSTLEVSHSNANESYGFSLYDFNGTQDEDLCFKANEKIYLTKKINDEWYFGRNKCGCEGMFPINYIDIKIPISNKDTFNLNQSSQVSPTNVNVRVLYSFIGELPEDLTIHENEFVEVLYEINQEWLYGRIGNRKGQFPSNFIECIPRSLPKMP